MLFNENKSPITVSQLNDMDTEEFIMRYEILLSKINEQVKQAEKMKV